MELQIGDKTFTVPRLKVRLYRTLLALVDQASESKSAAENLDLTVDFYFTLLNADGEVVTKEWLEDNLDVYMTGPVYFPALLSSLFAIPKNVNVPGAQKNASQPKKKG